MMSMVLCPLRLMVPEWWVKFDIYVCTVSGTYIYVCKICRIVVAYLHQGYQQNDRLLHRPGISRWSCKLDS